LVIVAEEKSWERLRYWGPLLNYAADPVMARLGQCEVACATPEAILAVLGLTRAPTQPWFWLLSQDKSPIAVDLAPIPPPTIDLSSQAAVATWEQLAADLHARAPQCFSAQDVEGVAVIMEQLRAVLAEKDWSMLSDFSVFMEDLARQLNDAATCANDADLQTRAQHLPSIHIEEDPRSAQRLALTELYLAALSELIEREVGGLLGPLPADSAALTARAVDLYRKKPVPNTRWGHSGGCGSYYERPGGGFDYPDSGIMCGMGYVPARLERFLSLYTPGSEP
jgi:hypothetical protein